MASTTNCKALLLMAATTTGNCVAGSPTSSGALIRKLDYADEKRVMALAHSVTGPCSLLLAATQQGSIHGVDLRAKYPGLSLQVPPYMYTYDVLHIHMRCYPSR
jgi:hypothetical protein